MPLTAEGYVERTPEEIKLAIVKRLQAVYSSFLQRPADVQNNAIDTFVASLVEIEQVCSTMCNSFAFNDSNDFITLQQAESLGLERKKSFDAQVDLTFTAKPGTYIPLLTKVSDESGENVFETQEAVIVDDSGIANILALGTALTSLPAQSLTKIVSVIDSTGVVSVTNNSASLKYVNEESLADLKARAQAKLRGARKGGIAYAAQIIQGLEGVENRLVSGRAVERKEIVGSETRIYNAIEFVVGGGSASKIANCLYQAFFEFQKLSSTPSNGESERSVSVSISVMGNPVTIEFTRPKEVKLSVICMLSMEANYINKDDLLTLLEKPILAYLNNIQVGSNVSKNALIKVTFDALETYGVSAASIRALDFEYQIEGASRKAFSNGFIAEIDYDCYVVSEVVNLEVK